MFQIRVPERCRCEKRPGLEPKHTSGQSQIDLYSRKGLTNQRYLQK